MSDRIIFDDAINHIAAAESLSNAETSALKSELIRDVLCHALKVYPRGSRVKYDFNKVYSQVPSAKFGSGDWCTVKTSEVEVYFNDLDKWLELNWPQLEFRLAKANPSSASDASRAGDTQASASDSNQADKEVEPDAPWIIFCKSQIDDIFQSRIASGQACGVGYLADELVARCKRKNLITKRNVKVSKDNVLKQVLMGWTAPEIE